MKAMTREATLSLCCLMIKSRQKVVFLGFDEAFLSHGVIIERRSTRAKMAVAIQRSSVTKDAGNSLVFFRFEFQVLGFAPVVPCEIWMFADDSRTRHQAVKFPTWQLTCNQYVNRWTFERQDGGLQMTEWHTTVLCRGPAMCHCKHHQGAPGSCKEPDPSRYHMDSHMGSALPLRSSLSE